MWRSRSKRVNNPQVRRTPSNPNFNYQSFKDIENLIAEDNHDDSDLKSNKEQSPTSSSSSSIFKTLNVFHRVRLANQFTRAFDSRPKALPQGGQPSTSELKNAPVKSEPSITIPPLPEGCESSTSELKNTAEKPVKSEPLITIPGAEKRIVVYTTSLRVVRPTFEACKTVQSILRGFRVSIDERDLSMDSSFLDELQKIMSQSQDKEIEKAKLTLPRVFIGGRYIGGVEEVRQLHEAGELKKFVEGLPPAAPGACEVCGGFRFILCNECSGSHKVYTEKGGFRSCTSCNENGLIRCPSCLSH